MLMIRVVLCFVLLCVSERSSVTVFDPYEKYVYVFIFYTIRHRSAIISSSTFGDVQSY